MEPGGGGGRLQCKMAIPLSPSCHRLPTAVTCGRTVVVVVGRIGHVNGVGVVAGVVVGVVVVVGVGVV